YVQEYRPISIDSMLYMKYAGVAIENGFVQVGYNASRFQEDIAEQVRYAAKNRHIGKAGFVMICDENFNVASSPYEEQIGEPIDFESKLTIKEILKIEGTIFEARGKMNYSSYCMFLRSEGYFIIASLPVEEAMFSRDIAVYVTVFMLSLVFAALFIHIYFLIKRLVVNNIHKVNSSLSQITDGNLNVKIDVRENEEFTSLSDDINSTVDTLKHYIDEAKARIDKELEFAKNIQHSALPNIFPPYPNRHEFDIYATMDAAKEVGGDFYDFYLMDNDRLCFLVADVSGKSIPGAMFMMRSKTILKSLAESGIEAGEIFTKANEKLCEGNDAGMFVTAWLGIIDIRSGILTYANAGHNPPLLRHKNGKFEYLRTRPNFVLAGMEGAKYRKNELQLLPGDEIFLYTDGVTEATDKNNELFGEDRLLSALNRNPDVSVENRCRAVKREIDKFVGDADQFDDITMLTVKTHFFQNYDSIMTSPDEASVEPVWEFINRKMKKAALPVKLANKVQIVVDEIYSNILRYSGATKAEVFCSIDEKDLTLTFKDNGVPYDPLQKNDPDITLSADDREIGGLGIFMVKKMASSIKYENTDGLNILKITFGI
ncbi:MAG: SpoIIE family protein phosphatase, partial [Eubacteriales bacterium]